MNRVWKDEKGQALIAVLILLLVGMLIVSPLLLYMGTGIKAAKVHEERMLELYAADSGIEDARYKIEHPPTPSEAYPLTVNGKDVEVRISQESETIIDFFKTIGALEPQGKGDYHKASPHGGQTEDAWMVVYSGVESKPGVYSTYNIDITYQGNAQQKSIYNLGCWIYGLYGADGGPALIEEEKGITDDYPNYHRSSGAFLGTYFLWEWKAAKRPSFSPGLTRTLTFTFSPPIILKEGQRFPPNVSWVKSTEDIFISWQGSTGMHHVVAVARDPNSGKSTTVDSHLFSESIGDNITASIMTWEISVQ